MLFVSSWGRKVKLWLLARARQAMADPGSSDKESVRRAIYNVTRPKTFMAGCQACVQRPLEPSDAGKRSGAATHCTCR